jgi:hypothetical protein
MLFRLDNKRAVDAQMLLPALSVLIMKLLLFVVAFVVPVEDEPVVDEADEDDDGT